MLGLLVELESGNYLLAADMDGAEAEETVAQIKAESDVKALSMVCNVTSKADIDSMVAAALDAFGRIVILNTHEKCSFLFWS